MDNLKAIHNDVKKYVKNTLRYKIDDTELQNIINMCIKGIESPYHDMTKNHIIFMYVNEYISTIKYSNGVVAEASAVDPNDASSIKLMLPKAISTLEAVEKIGGAISQKLDILKDKDNINNHILIAFFKYTYDWTMSYGIGDTFVVDINADKSDAIDPHILWVEFINILNTLKNKTAANNTDRENIRICLMKMPKKMRKWCMRIIYRDLRIGMKKANIKSVWNNLLPTFEVSLCSTLKNVESIDDIIQTTDIRIEPKYDGLRIIILVTDASNGIGNVYTRKGLVQDDLYYIVPQAAKLMLAGGHNSGVLDCEGVGQSKSYNDAVTAVRKAKSSTDGLRIMVFDYISVDGFTTGTYGVSSGDRRRMLYRMFKRVKNADTDIPNMRIVPTVRPRTDTSQSIINTYEMWRNEGYEGVVIKDNTSSYRSGERNRNKSGMYRIKPFDTIDVEIIGIFPGKPGTKYESTLGGFICKMDNGNTIRVGGGLTDAERHQFWTSGKDMIGRVIEVEMQSATKGIKARHTYFRRIRECSDK